MSAESIRLINAAISVTNLTPITSVNDGSPEAILADANYEIMAETALCRSRWKFARAVANCTLIRALTSDDSDTYSYEWQLPDDCIELRTVWINGQPIDYIITEDKVIWTQSVTVPKAVYTFRAAEEIWPPDFKTAFRTKLEAIYLRLDERATEAKARDEDGDKMFSRCALVHSQEEANHSHMKFPLITARRTGYAPLRR